MFVNQLLITETELDKKKILETNKNEINDLITAICVFIGYILKIYGISKFHYFFDEIKKIISLFRQKNNEDVYDVFNFLFFSLNSLIHFNIVDRNNISRFIIDNNNFKFLFKFELDKFLAEIYVSNINLIQSFDLNVAEKDLFELDYVNNAYYSLRQPNSLFSWLSSMELDNYVSFLIYSSMVFNEYVFFINKIKKNNYLNSLDKTLYNNILLSFINNSNMVESLNNKEALISQLKLIVENKQGINDYKDILTKLLFLSF